MEGKNLLYFRIDKPILEKAFDICISRRLGTFALLRRARLTTLLINVFTTLAFTPSRDST